MSILSGFLKTKKYRKKDDGNYQLQSEWTSSETVEMGDGNTLETNLGSIKGITSSLSSTDAGYALSASAGKSLQDNINTLNTNLGNKLNGTDYGLGTFTSSTATTSELSESIDNYKLINVVLVASASGNICASTIVTTRLFKTTSKSKTVRASTNSGENTYTGSAYYIDDTHIAGNVNSTDFNTVVYGIN